MIVVSNTTPLVALAKLNRVNLLFDLFTEIKADWVLMDEKKGRRKLDQLQIPYVGTAGLLLWAKKEGLLSEIRPELEQLRQRGFSLSQPVMHMILKQAGET